MTRSSPSFWNEETSESQRSNSGDLGGSGKSSGTFHRVNLSASRPLCAEGTCRFPQERQESGKHQGQLFSWALLRLGFEKTAGVIEETEKINRLTKEVQNWALKTKQQRESRAHAEVAGLRTPQRGWPHKPKESFTHTPLRCDHVSSRCPTCPA